MMYTNGYDARQSKRSGVILTYTMLGNSQVKASMDNVAGVKIPRFEQFTEGVDNKMALTGLGAGGKAIQARSETWNPHHFSLPRPIPSLPYLTHLQGERKDSTAKCGCSFAGVACPYGLARRTRDPLVLVMPACSWCTRSS
jgi:hypothetical protein